MKDSGHLSQDPQHCKTSAWAGGPAGPEPEALLPTLGGLWKLPWYPQHGTQSGPLREGGLVLMGPELHPASHPRNMFHPLQVARPALRGTPRPPLSCSALRGPFLGFPSALLKPPRPEQSAAAWPLDMARWPLQLGALLPVSPPRAPLGPATPPSRAASVPALASGSPSAEEAHAGRSAGLQGPEKAPERVRAAAPR